MDETKNRIIIVINDTNNINIQEYTSFVNREYIFIALTNDIKIFLNENNICCKSLIDYLPQNLLEEIEQNTRMWIKSWPNMMINGRSFIQLLAYSETSLWWFAESGLYNIIKTSITNIELVKQIFIKEKPDRIIIFGDGPLDDIFLNLVGIEAQKISNKQLRARLKFNLKSFVKHNPDFLWNIVRFYDLTKSLIAKVVSRKQILNSNQLEKTILIFSNNLDWRTLYDPILGQSRSFDSFFDSIITRLNENGNKIITTYPLGPIIEKNPAKSFVSGLRASIGRGKQDKVFHKPCEYYLTMDIDRKASKERKELLKIWMELKNSEEFKNSVNYKNINLWSLLEKDFSFFFKYMAGYAVKSIEIALNIINTEKPDLFLTGGTGELFYELSLITQSNRNKIPSIEIQHGVIIQNTTNYMHPKAWIPYKMAVYGPFYKRILSQDNEFPQNSIAVTGQPRYDILNKSKDIFKKESLCREFNIDTNKKLVLIITEGLPSSDKLLLEFTLGTLKKYKEIQVVIKPHPNEATEINKKIIEKESADAIILPKFENIFRAIRACDLLINTTFSTTTIEGALLNKPVITLNLAGHLDTIFKDSGVAIEIYRKEDLESAIKDALYNDEIRKKMQDSRKSFIYEHAYLQDGNASMRIVDLVMQTINESENRKVSNNET